MADISEININDIPYSIKDTQARSTINSVSTNLENYLPLSGGTLTGRLDINLSSTFINLIANNVDATTTPDSNKYENIMFLDKNNLKLGGIEITYRPDESIDTKLVAYNQINSGNNYFLIRRTAEGENTYSVSSPANFRNALGASNGVWPISLGGTGATSVTSGTGAVHNLFPTNLGTNIGFLAGLTSSYATTGYTKLPLAIALGGSGQDSITKTTGSRDADNTTAGTINIYKWGKVITVCSHNTMKLTSNLASHKSVAIGSIGSAYRPITIEHAWAGNNSNSAVIYIGSSTGIITLYNTGSDSISAGATINFTVTYIID